MAVAAISGTISTAIIGMIVLLMVVLIVRHMWKKKKAGGSCLCDCGNCAQGCHMKKINKGE